MKKWINWRRVVSYQRKVDRILDSGRVWEPGQKEKERERFIMSQILLVAAGLILLAGILIGSLVRELDRPDYISLNRPSFGQGDREIIFQLSGKDQKKRYYLRMKEQTLSPEEEEQIFEGFFKDLEKVMAGKNKSLSNVTMPLSFPDRLGDYPFIISYQPEDLAMINLEGKLGQKSLKGEGGNTQIEVTAVYEGYRRSHTFPVSIREQTEKDRTVFENVETLLDSREKDSREQSSFSLPSSVESITIRQEEGIPFQGPLACLLFLAIVPFYRHHSLQEKMKAYQEEAEKDFSLVVHLFVLFMEAGLSFSSSVSRIAEAYRQGKITTGKRLAFDRILEMEKRMKDGTGQKEALRIWAGDLTYSGYRKLAMIMIQSFSKGRKESALMLEEEEKQAFSERIDRVKKAGEKARTRLLFPMVLLLAVTMLLIMFPAVVSFYRF